MPHANKRTYSGPSWSLKLKCTWTKIWKLCQKIARRQRTNHQYCMWSPRSWFCLLTFSPLLIYQALFCTVTSSCQSCPWWLKEIFQEQSQWWKHRSTKTEEVEAGKSLHCRSSGTAFSSTRRTISSTVMISPNPIPNIIKLAVRGTVPWISHCKYENWLNGLIAEIGADLWTAVISMLETELDCTNKIVSKKVLHCQKRHMRPRLKDLRMSTQ